MKNEKKRNVYNYGSVAHIYIGNLSYIMDPDQNNLINILGVTIICTYSVTLPNSGVLITENEQFSDSYLIKNMQVNFM